MTRLEFTELFSTDLKPLWPNWKPEQALIDLYAEEFSRYESEDVRRAFRRHKTTQDYQEPKIPLVIKHLKAVVAERKAEERKHQGGAEWPGQVFVVIHFDDHGEVNRYWDFHVANPRAQVPAEFESHRMNQHLKAVQSTHGCRYKSGNWSSEIHTEETFRTREAEIKARWHEEQCQQRQVRAHSFASSPAVPIPPRSQPAMACGAGLATSEVPW